jgi:glucosamine-phosphate N-acetyltransferase
MQFINLYDYVVQNIEKIAEIKTQYLLLLSELTDATEITNKQFFENIYKINNIGKIMIGLENNETIICSGTIIIEPKIIRKGKSAAHIEDVVVLKKYRNKGIAKELLEELQKIAKNNDCYKIILNCQEHVQEFYEKSGFTQKGFQMVRYF